ncbi:MAG: hypothetical protein CMJ27_12415 [Phycisphaerae bacterium]|nr:hypothetical protein [Phycisphaerae bacterium]MAH67161.1 hypothetical protein [Phycisphaerae bacterium]OUX00166.1 MAG: hypothetical protein CBD91_07340 [Phycisphaeraceae bacterium TMED231]
MGGPITSDRTSTGLPRRRCRGHGLNSMGSADQWSAEQSARRPQRRDRILATLVREKHTFSGAGGVA